MKNTNNIANIIVQVGRDKGIVLNPQVDFEVHLNAHTDPTKSTYKLFWKTDKMPYPTIDELNAAEDRANANEQLYSYKQKRALEYPSVQEQLDAMWHSIDTYNKVHSGAINNLHVIDWFNTIKAVKDKYPRFK